jgi:hypothetical protein
MKANPNSTPKSPLPSLALFVLVFAAGIALTGIWFHRHDAASKSDGLSDSTRTMLGQLATPVIIRYYSLLPAGSADESLQAFAGRVPQLLNAMQAASHGNIQLSVVDAPAETNSAAASADGVQAFNLEKGDACFLGLAIASGKNHESFARLSPEWEAALEFDLARAIQRVAATAAPARPAPEVAQPSTEIIASIHRLIPDVNATSTGQADQIFHAEFVKQCAEIGTETEAEFNAAQQKVVEAQNSGDAAALETARKNLAQVQLAQGEKFKNLAAQLQTRLAVFQQMKSGATNAAP